MVDLSEGFDKIDKWGKYYRNSESHFDCGGSYIWNLFIAGK